MSAADPLIERDESLVVDGTVIGHFHLYRASTPAAELFAAEVDVQAAAEAIIANLSGWNLTTTDDDLAGELLARGAVASRRYALMSADLHAATTHEALHDALPLPDSLDSISLTPTTEVTSGFVELVRRAYPPGHPDEELGSDDEISGDVTRALQGHRLGPLMAASRLLLDGRRPVAMALLNRVPGRAPTGGPWLTDLCRDPEATYAGLGRALLVQVMRTCQHDGERTVSLAVTDGNPARRVYEDVGFAVAATTRKLRLPGETTGELPPRRGLA